MKINECTEERFLADIKDHTMTVVFDDGIRRHLSFSRGGSSVYRFDLITWPGSLCIDGDCGTYVFRRLTDMFEFFRMDDNDFNKKRTGLSINPGYWGEKLTSIGTNAGYKEFDEEAFKERVTRFFDDYWEDSDDPDKEDCWKEIEDDVLSCIDNEHEAYNRVYDFNFGKFHFQDFFDGGGTEQYTFHYIWCLYAIAYGVREYDKRKK